MRKSKLENTWKYLLVFAVLFVLVGGFYLFAGGQQSILGEDNIIEQGNIRGAEKIVYEETSCSDFNDCKEYFIGLGVPESEISEEKLSCENKMCVVMS